MYNKALASARVGRIVIILSAFIALCTGRALSASMQPAAATPPPKPSAVESAFISDVARQLLAKYPTDRAALGAGYYRTTRLEPDGTIIYFNDKWNPTKLRPNFLWFDKFGKLMGLDYQYPVSDYPKPPGRSMFPVQASRWTTIDPHIHYGYQLPDGKVVRKGHEMLASMKGNTLTEGELRQAKLVPAHAKLLWTYVHPKSWDLGFWLVPNPNGAFADRNPNVKP